MTNTYLLERRCYPSKEGAIYEGWYTNIRPTKEGTTHNVKKEVAITLRGRFDQYVLEGKYDS